MDKAEEELLREYEKQLDEHHKSLALWERARPEAIYAVVGTLDAGYLPLVHGIVDVSLAQQFKGLEEGVSQALRWLTSEGCTSVWSVADQQLMEEAGRFCMYASDYVQIADLHISCGRGWATAQVDSSSRTVTFNPVDGPGQSAVIAYHEDVQEQASRGMELWAKLKQSDVRRALDLLRGVEHRLVNGHIHLGQLSRALLEETRVTLRLSRQFELVPLPVATDMLGFTMEEFWLFMETVTLWSRAAFIRYVECVRQGVPQHECMPTQIVADDDFLAQVTMVSGLSAECVETILDRLTFHPGPKADILLTPFLRAENSICWSPARIVNYAHERNLLKVMSRGTKPFREHAANANGKRCRSLGCAIGNVFSKHGYQFKLDTPIAANGESTDVDVCLYQTARPDEILIIEAKALIASDEVNEVYEATQALIYAQQQVQRAIRILRAMPHAQKQQKLKFVNWAQVTQYFGVVITTDGEPHSPVDPKQVPVLTYASLRTRLRPRDLRYPSRFWKICTQRPWLPGEIIEEERRHRDLKIGDLVYRLPERVVSTPADELERPGEGGIRPYFRL